MTSLRKIVILLLGIGLLGTLVACKGDPNVEKQKYLESGNRYLDKKQFKEASIQYQNAIQIDPNYAEAHYKLSKSYMGVGNFRGAFTELKRTVELKPDYTQAQLDLGNLYAASRNWFEAEQSANGVLTKDPNNAAAHALLASVNAGQNKLSEAKAEMDKAIQVDPKNANFRFQMGLLQVRMKSTSDAEQSFKKTLELDPKMTIARITLGDFYASQGNYPLSEQTFKDAIAADPQSIPPYVALSRFYVITKRPADAEQVLSNAKKTLDDNPDGYRLLGEYYVASGNIDKALAEFQALYQQHPKDLKTKKAYIELLLSKNRTDEATKLVDEILDANKKDTDAEVLKARILIGAGKYNDAVSLLQAAIKDQADNASAHLQLGKAFDLSGDPGRAESEWREAARLNPNMLEAQQYLAGVGIRKGDIDLLRSSSEQIIRLRPGDPAGYIFRANAEAAQKDASGAEADLNKAISLAPNSALGYTKMGIWRTHEKKYPEAEKSFETALDKDPNFTEAMVGISDLYTIQKRPLPKLIARINQQIGKAPQNDTYWALLGQTQARTGDMASARSSFEHALSINQNNGAAMIQLAQMDASSGNINGAVANYEKLIQANPHNPIPMVMLGTVEEARGNFDKAQQDYQKALQVRPDYPLAANNLAYLMMQHGGNLDVALSLAQTARRGMPDNPSIADTLGWAYYLKGVYGSARDLFEEAAKKDPSNATVQYHLGLTYDKTSDPDKATMHLKKALELAPNGPNAAAIKQALSGKS